MNLTSQLAKQIRQVHFVGNWTAVNLQDTLENVNWKQANKQIKDFNTIVSLVYHINYYIDHVSNVVEGGKLKAKDKYAFDHPKIHSEKI